MFDMFCLLFERRYLLLFFDNTIIRVWTCLHYAINIFFRVETALNWISYQSLYR